MNWQWHITAVLCPEGWKRRGIDLRSARRLRESKENAPLSRSNGDGAEGKQLSVITQRSKMLSAVCFSFGQAV